MRKKRRLKKKPIIILILFIIIIIILIMFLAKLLKKEKIKKVDMLLASEEYVIKTYNLDYTEAIEIPRGNKVVMYEKEYKDKNDETKKYNKIIYDNKEYYIDLYQLVELEASPVLEKEIYVRTPVTVYKNSEDNSILGYVKKGEKLDIVGYDKLDDNGIVNMYKVKYNEEEGYVYSKYLLKDEEKAKENYNEDGIYDTHKNRKFSYDLFGGSAANLDYYPFEKKEFEDNPLLKDGKTLYMNGGNTVIDNVDSYIEIAKNSGINSIVVDIKDGNLAYDSNVAIKYLCDSEERCTKAKGNNSFDKYKDTIKKIKDADIYVIGRIVAFNDPYFAKANTSEAILNTNGTPTTWVSAYSRKAWEYNVSLAIEAIKEFGFNEIQFDYVRFSEASYSMSKNKQDFRNKYEEDKAVAIQNFVIYAVDQIHKYNAYVSIDVFGECSSTYVTAYGQYWPAISNVADVISAMPYPDHFAAGSYGISVPWTEPYKTMLAWAKTAATRQKEIKTPAVARTWIQAYNAIREPYNTYGPKEITSQINGLKDAGLTGGYITWNAASNINKYKNLSSAFK